MSLSAYFFICTAPLTGPNVDPTMQFPQPFSSAGPLLSAPREWTDYKQQRCFLCMHAAVF
jgi:hypothetical protein